MKRYNAQVIFGLIIAININLLLFWWLLHANTCRIERLEIQIQTKQVPVRFDHLNVTVETPPVRTGLPTWRDSK